MAKKKRGAGRGAKVGRGSSKAKPKAAAKGAAEKTAAGVKPQAVEVRKLISGGALRDLLRECRGLQADASSITGSIREKIGYAKEHKHLNPPAFALLRKFDKLEPENASTLYYDFMAYMESSGVLEKIESVGRLPLEDEQHPAPQKDKTGGARKPRAAKEPKDADPKPGDQNGNGQQQNPPPDPQPDAAENVSRPQFGQRPAAQAPGGPVKMLN